MFENELLREKSDKKKKYISFLNKILLLDIYFSINQAVFIKPT